MYFVKNNPNDCKCKRHRIHIPTTKQGYHIKSGTVSYQAGRYYVSVLVDVQEDTKQELNDFGLGIDLGIKNFAVMSNGITTKNINKTARLMKLEKRLKREQRSLSRKYENKKKGASTQKNIQKQKLKVQKLHQRISNIRTDYINKTVAKIVKTKPSYRAIEYLNVPMASREIMTVECIRIC